jgi:hypothetical protein
MIPKSSIIFKKANVGELIYSINNAPFSGSYYEYANKKYAGDQYNVNAPELTTPVQSNQLLNSFPSNVFSLISGITSQQLQKFSQPVVGINAGIAKHADDTNVVRFYCTKTNEVPYIIKQIDESTYLSLSVNPFYKTTYTGTYNEKYQSEDEAEKQIPGLKVFLGA